MTDYQSDYGAPVDTILIVDDEPNNLKVLYDLLTQNSYEVLAARDGRAALEAVVAQRPDLILLDIKMPGMDGYEVCEGLKAHPETREIPVIFISALNQVEDIVKAFQGGGVDYITKPFQFEEVLARVQTHLKIIQQQQQLMMQQEQIEAMRQRDRERFDTITKMRDQFVRAAAHDLKNPLTLVTGYASMMKRFNEIRSDPQLKESVEQIEIAGNEMMELITDMLDVIRIQNGIELQLVSTQMNDLIAEQVNAHNLAAEQRQITLNLSLPEEDVVMDVDRRLIQRLVENLVSNALKYSPDGSRIDVVASVAENQFIFSVQDDGYGILPDDLPHIFDPFYRASTPAKNIEGTGLGLSIVKEIVDQHRGVVDVESIQGQGTTFTVYLPLM